MLSTWIYHFIVHRLFYIYHNHNINYSDVFVFGGICVQLVIGEEKGFYWFSIEKFPLSTYSEKNEEK